MTTIVKRVGDYKMAVSSQGGTVSELKWRDINIFYPRQMVDGKLRGGNPVCCPFFGKLDEFPGLPRHGWFREEELDLKTWEIDGVCKIGCHPIVLKRDDYLWFVYGLINHSLSASGLFTVLSVSSYIFRSPVNPGFHPYFPTFGGECKITSGYETIAGIENGEQGEFPAQLFPFPHLGRIYIQNKNGIISMMLSGDFSKESSVVIWSDKVEEYICVEPVFRKVGEYAELGKNGLKEIELCVAFTFAPH